MSAEFEAGVKELETVVVPAEKAEVITKSLVENLVETNSRMMDLVNWFVPGRAEKLAKAKAHEGKETPEEEALEEKERAKKEEGTEKSGAKASTAQETLSKSLTESASYQEVVEASQALRDLEQGISKSLGQIEKSNDSRFDRIETGLAGLAKAMGLICSAQAIIKKSFDAQPKSQPFPGYFGSVAKSTGSTEQNGVPNRDEISLKLTQMVQEGKAQPSILSKFDTQPAVALSMISSDLKKSYGIPDTI